MVTYITRMQRDSKKMAITLLSPFWGSLGYESIPLLTIINFLFPGVHPKSPITVACILISNNPLEKNCDMVKTLAKIVGSRPVRIFIHLAFYYYTKTIINQYLHSFIVLLLSKAANGFHYPVYYFF